MQAVLLVVPLAILVVGLFYAKPEAANVDFYWGRMFAPPGAPRWRRTVYELVVRMGRTRRRDDRDDAGDREGRR